MVEGYLPNVSRLKNYRAGWLRADVVAGLTITAYLVPQCMAYAQLAGLPPVVGLWAALAPMLLYAFLGSSPQLSVGPESTTAILTATALAPLALGDGARYAALAAGLAVLVGLICIAGRLLRLGFLADLLSRPTLVGYLAGVALIMIAGQLDKVSGVAVNGDHFLEQIRSFVSNIGDLDAETLLLALGVLAFLFLVQWRFPRSPGPLLAVLLSTVVVAVAHLDDNGVRTVGEIPGGFPNLQWPDVSWKDLSTLIGPAFGIAVVGFTDNVLTARAFASRHRQEVDANQELLALGAANLGAGVTQGFPVSSSGSRTVLGDQMGSKTQVTSLAVVVGLVLVLLFLRPLLAEFPLPALGAIVIFAAVHLIDVDAFRRMGRLRHSEQVLALSAFVGVLAFDIVYGVLIAVVLSVLDLFRRVARPHDAVLGTVPGLAGLHDVDDFPDAHTIRGLVIYRYDAFLCFANADDFRTRALAAVDGEPERVEWLVLNMEANVEVDVTATDALWLLRSQLEQRNIRLGLARVKQDLFAQLEPVGLVDAIGCDMIFPTLPTVLEAFAAREGGPVDDGG